MEVNGLLHAPATLPEERAPGIHCVQGWAGSRASLDVMEKRKISHPCQESNLDSLVTIPTEL
jgi:hypothetical protein